MNQTIDCQIAIVGGGLSGMFAAVRSAELGIKQICIIEAGHLLGGNGRMAATFVSSDFSDYGDSSTDTNAVALFRKTMRELHYTGQPKVIQRYLFRTREIASWLEDRHLPMAPLTWGMFRSDCSRNVESPGYNDGLAPSIGTNVCKLLIEECSASSAIHVLTDTRAVSLLTDGQGTVNGLLAKGKDGHLLVHAEKVILACGGVAGSEASLAEYTPKYVSPGDKIRIRGVRSCVGDGIKMAGAIGAKVDNPVQIHLLGAEYGGYSGPLFSPLTDVMRDPRNLVLSSDGKRIMDESGYMESQDLVNTLPGKCLYGMFDQTAMEQVWPQRRRGELPLEELSERLSGDVQKKYLCLANTLEEAANFIGCSPAVLCASVERYNQLCAAQCDLDYRKPAEFLMPVEKPPFYVLCAIRAVDSTQGGISINEHLEALRPDGTPIAGMYVIGDHATGFVSEYYAPAGAGMTWAMTSGYMAGEDAANAILEKPDGYEHDTGGTK